MIKSRNYAIGYHSPTSINVRAIFTYKDDSIKYFDRVFNITFETWKQCFAKWCSGVVIQDAFPMLTSEQREFMMTGNVYYEELKKAYPNMVIGQGGDA